MNEPDDALPGGPVLLDHLGAEDVGRHQVRRELDAVEFQVHAFGERLDEEGLRQPRDPAQQAVAASKERNEDLADDPLLTDDRLAELGLQTARDFGDVFERVRSRVSVHR